MPLNNNKKDIKIILEGRLIFQNLLILIANLKNLKNIIRVFFNLIILK